MNILYFTVTILRSGKDNLVPPLSVLEASLDEQKALWSFQSPSKHTRPFLSTGTQKSWNGLASLGLPVVSSVYPS
jgi:hypothetical protein